MPSAALHELLLVPAAIPQANPLRLQRRRIRWCLAVDCSVQSLVLKVHACQERCGMWAASGECEANPGFMKHSCRISCNTCIGSKKTLQTPPAQVTSCKHTAAAYA